MIKLLLKKFRRFVRVLTTDEGAAASWFAATSNGLGAFFLTGVITILPFADATNPTDIVNMVRGWTKGDWFWRLAITGFFALRGMVKARAPNLTIDEIHTALAARGAIPKADVTSNEVKS